MSRDLLSFSNTFARNILIFEVSNSSSYHADNCKKNFVILGEGQS